MSPANPVIHGNASEMKSLSKEPQGSPYRMFSNKQVLLSCFHWEICSYSLETERSIEVTVNNVFPSHGG